MSDTKNGHRITGSRLEEMNREELHSLVWPKKDEKNRNAYDLRYLRLFGTSAGVMLSQLVYWTTRGHDSDGWVYKTKEEIIVEFGLGTVYEVNKARHRLEDEGVLETERRPRRGPDGTVRHPSPVLHYRVKLAALAERLREQAEQDQRQEKLNYSSKPATFADSSTPDSQTPVDHLHSPESGKEECSYTETTTQTKTEKKEWLTPLPLRANDYVGWLVWELEQQGFFLDSDQKKKYAGNFGTLQRKGIEHGELCRVKSRIVAEWPRHQLSPQAALGDLRGERNKRKDEPLMRKGRSVKRGMTIDG